MNKKTILLIVCQVIVILLLVHLVVLRGFVTSTAKLDTLFVEAKTYIYTAEIIKSEIKNNLPEKIQNNFIEKAIVTKAIDYLITPKLIQDISKKPIALVIAAINKKGKTEIVNNRVVLETATYKKQLTQNIVGWQLPKELETMATEALSSIPAQIKIVDLEKNPNSFIGYLVKARIYVNQLKNIIVALTLILIAFIALLFIINRQKLRIAGRAMGWVLGYSGVFMIIFSYLGSPTLNSVFLVGNPTTVDALLSNLALAIGTYYVRLPGPSGILLLIIGLIIVIVTKPNFIKQFKDRAKSIKAKISPKTPLAQ